MAFKKKILFKQSIPHTQTKEDDKTIVKTRRLWRDDSTLAICYAL